MDFNKVDLTEVVDKMAMAFAAETWDGLKPPARQEIRQTMLDLLLPGADAFEVSVRRAVAEEIRAMKLGVHGMAEEVASRVEGKNP